MLRVYISERQLGNKGVYCTLMCVCYTWNSYPVIPIERIISLPLNDLWNFWWCELCTYVVISYMYVY